MINIGLNDQVSTSLMASHPVYPYLPVQFNVTRVQTSLWQSLLHCCVKVWGISSEDRGVYFRQGVTSSELSGKTWKAISVPRDRDRSHSSASASSLQRWISSILKHKHSVCVHVRVYVHTHQPKQAKADEQCKEGFEMKQILDYQLHC